MPGKRNKYVFKASSGRLFTPFEGAIDDAEKLAKEYANSCGESVTYWAVNNPEAYEVVEPECRT